MPLISFASLSGARNRSICHPSTRLLMSFSRLSDARNSSIWHSNNKSYLGVEKDVVEYPKPPEIPYEAQNSVILTGWVREPVALLSSQNGDVSASTTIRQIPLLLSPPNIWVPVMFRGDLARLAACHLKENDHVSLSGQLLLDPGAVNFRVLVNSIKFIEPFFQTIEQNGSVGRKKVKHTWHDLIDFRTKWWDNRSHKLTGTFSPNYPDFKRKDGTGSLWLNNAPKRVLSILESLEFNVDSLEDVKSKDPKQRNVATGMNSGRTGGKP